MGNAKAVSAGFKTLIDSEGTWALRAHVQMQMHLAAEEMQAPGCSLEDVQVHLDQASACIDRLILVGTIIRTKYSGK